MRSASKAVVGWILALACAGVNADDADDLRDAARKGDLERIRSSIASKVDVNAASAYGVTALSLACDHGHADAVRELLNAGADPNVQDKFYRFTPLGWAVMRKHASIVRELADRDPKDFDKSFSMAVGSRDKSVVDAFLESKKLTQKGILDGCKVAIQSKQDDLAKQLRTHLSGESIAELEKWEVGFAASQAHAVFVGTYKNDEGVRITFRSSDGILTLVEGDPSQTINLDSSENKNQFNSQGKSIRFDSDGIQAKSAFYTIGGVETKYDRVNDNDFSASISTENAKSRFSVTEDFPLNESNWPNFRGTLSRGVSTAAKPPIEWNGETGKNIEWKTPVPGLGTSSPIVWNNFVFVSTAVQDSDTSGFRTGSYGDVESVMVEGECSYRLICINAENGEVLWEREACREVPKVKRHAKSSHANPTPATDGKHIIVSFAGAGIYCYDYEGKLIWSKDLGKLDSGWFYDRSYQWGFGSSPFLFEGNVILQCDHQEGAFVAAYDIETGAEKWRTMRDDIPTWSSPVGFLASDATPMVVVAGTKASAGYHARTGEPLWRIPGFSEIVVPTPQITRDLILLASGYSPVQPIVAMSHLARGELKLPSEKESADPFYWSMLKGGPYMPTPLILKDKLFVLDNSGIFSCYGIESGTRIQRQRLRSEKATAYTSSPVATSSHVYCTSEEGTTFVVEANESSKIVSQNSLGESVLSTPAIAGKTIYIRGEKHLHAIREK